MTAPARVLRRFRTCHRGKCCALADVELLNIMVLRDVRICRGENGGRLVFWVETGQNLLWRNRWNDSARHAVLLAEKQWISVPSNQQAGGYEALVAEKTHPEPEWPDLTLNEVLKLAFGDRLILDVDHPVLRKLRGASE
jgi:hypothetical protein